MGINSTTSVSFVKAVETALYNYTQ